MAAMALMEEDEDILEAPLDDEMLEEVDEVSMEVDECEEWEEWDGEEDGGNPLGQCAHLGLHEMPLQAIRASTMSRAKPVPNFASSSHVNAMEGAQNEEKVRFDDEPFFIVPGLYLGGEAHAKREYMLQRIGVTHILGIHDTATSHFPKSFSYLIIPIRDKTEVNITEHFKDAHGFIRNAINNNGTVFVHCWAGMSRSATIVISYLMSTLQISLNEALRQVVLAKPDVNPNTGFLFQLRQYESALGLSPKGPNSSVKRNLQKPISKSSHFSSNPPRKGKGSNKPNRKRK
jgi:protein-tyrosine phosphatase